MLLVYVVFCCDVGTATQPKQLCASRATAVVKNGGGFKKKGRQRLWEKRRDEQPRRAHNDSEAHCGATDAERCEQCKPIPSPGKRDREAPLLARVCDLLEQHGVGELELSHLIRLLLE